MKKIIKYSAVVVTAMLLTTACNNNNRPVDPSVDDSSPMMTGFPASSNNPDTDPMYTLPDGRDFSGTYEGTLPAADADGIQTSLKLYNDNTYERTSVYIGKSDNAIEERGTYEVKGDILTLIANGSEEYYQVGEGYITKLDNDKQPITGDFAENYKLIKR
ncbi:MAG: copper resistance protein NlpE N-terminal domain-containing protein [Tannerellaceae bacterium]|nr:copper resistance protein NlpE N-terminal domain-containing protein [Tannerellaceae bacterium]